MPSAANEVQDRRPGTAEAARLAKWQFINSGAEKTVAADRPDVAAVAAAAERVGYAASAGFAGESARGGTVGVAQILGPGPGAVERQSVARAMRQFGLHRVVDA